MAEAAGGRIESVTEPWLADLSGLGGKVTPGVTEWINAEYSRKLSVNVKDAQARLRLLGSYAHGEAPYGYAVAYDQRHADLMTELRRLKALPVTPAKVITVATGRTQGDAFRAMDFSERQVFIRLWVLTVFPPGADPQWELTYLAYRDDCFRVRQWFYSSFEEEAAAAIAEPAESLKAYCAKTYQEQAEAAAWAEGVVKGLDKERLHALMEASRTALYASAWVPT